MPPAKNETITLRIDSLSSDGNGVGRCEGKAVFVPAAAPGDVLQAKIVKDAKTHAFARIEQLLEAGAGRQAPDCLIFPQCGGCDFRHISYACELEAKQNFVQDALRRLAKLEIEVLPIIPSPEVNRYRNKAQYPLVQRAGGLSYGFYANRSHRVIPCEDCLLQPEIFNEITARCVFILQQLGVPAYDEAAHTGLVRHVYLRRSAHSGEVMLCLVLAEADFPQREAFLSRLLPEFPQISTVILNINTAKTNVICGPESVSIYGSGSIADSLAGVPVRLSPLSFLQINTASAENMLGIIRKFAAPRQDDTLLDIYCGAGVIGLSMADVCKRVIGVEIVPDAVQSARASARMLGQKNARFYCEDAGNAAQRLADEGTQVDIILLDPPRKGCDMPTLEAALRLMPAKLVMVSCNPATLARDLAFLVQNGYDIQKVQPVDMFPRTKHVETVCLMERRVGQGG